MENRGNKSIESLEKEIWPPLDSDEGSHLIITCNQLRKKSIGEFSVEALRIKIGQSIGLKFLVPLAIEVLEKDILAEGDYYEGDLLTSVLWSDIAFWKAEPLHHKTICNLFKSNESKLRDFDTTWEIKKKWFASFKDFEALEQAGP